MPFSTEAERLVHPQAGLIPSNLWVSIFNSDISAK